MKLLKLLVVPIIFLITILIINYTKSNKIYYISLGDELGKGINSNNYEDIGYSDFIKEYLEKNNKLKYYTKDFSDTDIRVTDLIRKIENNEEKEITIQNALKNSDLITISAGLNEIYNKYNTDKRDLYNYIDEIIYNVDYLLNLIRKINQNSIYFLGFYNAVNSKELDKYIEYANNKLIKTCNKYNVKYVDLYNLFKNNKHLIYNINNIYPNKDGYKLISNEILKNM